MQQEKMGLLKKGQVLCMYALMDRKRLMYMLIHTCWHVNRCVSSGGVTVAQLYLYAWRTVRYCSLVIVSFNLSFQGRTT